MNYFIGVVCGMVIGYCIRYFQNRITKTDNKKPDGMVFGGGFKKKKRTVKNPAKRGKVSRKIAKKAVKKVVKNRRK